MLRAVAQTPARMAELGKPSVRDAILASSDQAAAVGMMLQASSMPDPNLHAGRTCASCSTAASARCCCGRSIRCALVATAVLALVLLLMMKRLLFGTRPKIVVQQGQRRARRPPLMRLVTSETIPDRPIEQGEMVYACAVSGANILRDMREAVINTIGGHMTKYEALLDQTIARALDVLSRARPGAGL